MKRKFISAVISLLLIAFVLLMLFPIVFTVLRSFIAEEFTLKGYADFFIWQPEYIRALVRSLIISGAVTLLSAVIAISAAYVFAKVPFRGRGIIFFLYIIVMIMPFQVTLLPHYMISRNIGSYDTPLALILPGIFAPFAVFLLTQMMRSLPNEALEAARLETSSIFVIMTRIVIPAMKPGIACAAVLTFSEEWNKIAEPQALLESPMNFPLSMLLTGKADPAICAGTVIFLLFPLILFGFFEEEISEGLKEYKLK
ncbi:MAG: carbohydrate ABC transporter permease [Clostridia bacterium]|nr:carbohydrate ABC transporter permease [Clostridia bacterium]